MNSRISGGSGIPQAVLVSDKSKISRKKINLNREALQKIIQENKAGTAGAGSARVIKKDPIENHQQ